MSMQTSFTGALTPNMVAPGKISGPTAQNTSPLYAMLNSWDMCSSLQSETIDKDAEMQQLLTEAYAEFKLEEPAEVPGSV